METIFVKPKAGFKIRRPDTNSLLSEDGESVPKNTFWARRLLDGDVVEAKAADKKDSKQEQTQADVEDVAMAEEPAKKGGRK
jgi:uncharacterized protein DUF2635